MKLVDKTEPGTLMQTVADGVYVRMVEAILFGDLASSSRLNLQELAEKYQVSMSPVREALQRLAAEGFIETIPRRGFRIRKPSARHVTELWRVRLGLELMAGELLIEQIQTTKDLSAVLQMESIQAEIDNRTDLTQREHIELNSNFHRRLIDGAGNQLLASVYHGIQMQLMGAWVQRGIDDWRARLGAEREEHHQIINALKEGNPAQLVAAIRGHLGRSLNSAIDDLSAQLEPAEGWLANRAHDINQRQGTTQ